MLFVAPLGCIANILKTQIPLDCLMHAKRDGVLFLTLVVISANSMEDPKLLTNTTFKYQSLKCCWFLQSLSVAPYVSESEYDYTLCYIDVYVV